MVLISFTVKNWMSFKEEVTLSMVAAVEAASPSEEDSQHLQRLPEIKQYDFKVLPVAAIYGGNASGKSNLIKAIKFAKEFVVEVTQPDALIPVDYYLLDSECQKLPTEFKFEILVNEKVYEFSFSVTRKEVMEEKLIEILPTEEEKILYHRFQGEIKLIDDSLKQDKFLDVFSQTTRDNQLFLTNCITQNDQNFKPIYNWFRDSIEILSPNFRSLILGEFLEEDDQFSFTMNKIISELDTGIISLKGK